MNVSTSASVVMPKPRDEVFELCTQHDTYERHLQPRPPVAGVQRVELFDGHTLKPGDHRWITLTDGSRLDEEIIEHAPPAVHAYRWTTGLKGPFALMVRSGTGTWRFTEVDGGTRVDWQYDFALKTPLFYPLALGIMPLFRAWLKQGLESIRSELAG